MMRDWCHSLLISWKKRRSQSPTMVTDLTNHSLREGVCLMDYILQLPPNSVIPGILPIRTSNSPEIDLLIWQTYLRSQKRNITSESQKSGQDGGCEPSQATKRLSMTWLNTVARMFR